MLVQQPEAGPSRPPPLSPGVPPRPDPTPKQRRSPPQPWRTQFNYPVASVRRWANKVTAAASYRSWTSLSSGGASSGNVTQVSNSFEGTSAAPSRSQTSRRKHRSWPPPRGGSYTNSAMPASPERHRPKNKRRTSIDPAIAQGPVSVVVVENDVVGYATGMDPLLRGHEGAEDTNLDAMGCHRRSISSLSGSTRNGVDNDASPNNSVEESRRSFRRGSDYHGVAKDRRGSMTRGMSEESVHGKDMWRNFYSTMQDFWDQHFDDPATERRYQREEWYIYRPIAILCSLWILLSWILGTALNTSYSVWSFYSYIGICGVLTLPLPILVLLNGPVRSQWVYQPILLGAAWCWAFVIAIDMYTCKYFTTDPSCGDADFKYLFVAAFGPPTLAVIGMRQNRVLHMLAATAWFIMTVIMFLPAHLSPRSFARNFICFELYHMLLAVMSHLRDKSSRQLFILRHELKAQCGAAQRAKDLEIEAEHSKKRFVSYIFHEVRVPLNTALLAAQNLDGEGVFEDIDPDQRDMVHGLMGSLTMMEKVLNDVLSFNRMESGNFVLARKPFDFHHAIHVVALSNRVKADLTGIDFHLDLDPAIDELGGTLVGDEMRLMQVTSNLVSNALKFTHKGTVRIVTKLLHVHKPDGDPASKLSTVGEGSDEVASGSTLATTATDWRAGQSSDIPCRRSSFGADVEKGSPSAEDARYIKMHSSETHPPSVDDAGATWGAAVVRIEVQDTGVGLRPRDVASNGLFSPYVQTEIGRRQGGKGSGLGLALCMQIVKLCNGRIGVESQHGKGSTFWFELPYYLPPPGRQAPKRKVSDDESSFFQQMLESSDNDSAARPQISPSFSPEPPSPRQSSGREFPPGLAYPEERAAVGAANRAEFQRRHSDEPEMYDLDIREPREAEDQRLVLPVRLAHFRNRSDTLVPTRANTHGSRMLSRARYALVHGHDDGHSYLLPDKTPPDSDQPDSDQDSTEPRPVPMASTGPPASVSACTSPTSPPPAERPHGYSPLSLSHGQERPVSFDWTATASAPPPRQPPSPLSRPNIPRSSTPDPIDLPRPVTPPRAHYGNVSISTDARPSHPEAPSSLRVLVVDDDNLTRRLMSRMITRLGHQATQAENGQVALDLLREAHEDSLAEQYDIVFLDNQMPLVSGVEVVRELRRWGSSIFIVGCTGNALAEDQEEYMEAGADDLMTKPVHQKGIVERLAEAARRRRARDHVEKRRHTPKGGHGNSPPVSPSALQSVVEASESRDPSPPVGSF